jgi:hypothetical protein
MYVDIILFAVDVIMDSMRFMMEIVFLKMVQYLIVSARQNYKDGGMHK